MEVKSIQDKTRDYSIVAGSIIVTDLESFKYPPQGWVGLGWHHARISTKIELNDTYFPVQGEHSRNWVPARVWDPG